MWKMQHCKSNIYILHDSSIQEVVAELFVARPQDFPVRYNVIFTAWALDYTLRSGKVLGLSCAEPINGSSKNLNGFWKDQKKLQQFKFNLHLNK